MTAAPAGIGAPILTPFDADGAIVHALYAEHARRCLDEGRHFLSPFGTTGEAASVGLGARMAALDALIDAGLPAAALVPGTGTPSLDDTLALTRHAVGAGCRAAMVHPPYYFRNAGEDGVFRWFARLIEGVADDRLRLVLYHIPKFTGMAVPPALAHRLAEAFPGTIAGLKDSDGDWANTAATIETAPALAVFPGSETFLIDALGAGGAGAISATANINADMLRGVHDRWRSGAEAAARRLAETMVAIRREAEGHGLIGGLKAMLAAETGETAWLRLLPPHEDADPDAGRALLDRVTALRAEASAAA